MVRSSACWSARRPGRACVASAVPTHLAAPQIPNVRLCSTRPNAPAAARRARCCCITRERVSPHRLWLQGESTLNCRKPKKRKSDATTVLLADATPFSERCIGLIASWDRCPTLLMGPIASWTCFRWLAPSIFVKALRSVPNSSLFHRSHTASATG